MAPPSSRGTRAVRVTAADVAAASGVSRATVSYVLNDTPGQTIPETTRRRVMQAAADLGYVPSVHARALASGSTGIVVIDTSTIPHGELVANATRALSRALVERGYVPVVNQYTGADAGGEVLVALAERLRPEVVLALGDLDPALVARLEGMGVARVVAASSQDHIGVMATLQVAHLAEHGHRSLVYVAPPEPELAGLSELRLAAARAEATARGVALTAIPLAEQEPLAAELVRLRAAGATAVAAYNDEVAVGVLGAARRAGIAVPVELAVIGIDDLPLARRTHPQLTTVSQSDGDHPQIGPEQIDAVLAGEQPILPPVRPRVVVRGSV
ncbi:LacI family DNA-binding transcriptional regulator [Microbacterium oryzae]|uniref:LacI family DNA-binding transcriptional regulator n=1 Tax=Microbacterium oryzae TaxID=743009 RepID=UPI0025AFF75E|nr:LacI family DNA-binding transcriptional regulator [Microbacterium oryzae]MDN3310924.1 LacI family DNA-binding transcriptional regulator [Microbacterium oryzae]